MATVSSMTREHGESPTPSLDEWIKQEGEAAVIAAVEDTRRRVADGSLPTFEDEGEFLAYLERGHRQSA